MNVSLSAFYILGIAFGMREQRLKKIRIWLFGPPLALGFGLSFAVIPFVTQSFIGCQFTADLGDRRHSGTRGLLNHPSPGNHSRHFGYAGDSLLLEGAKPEAACQKVDAEVQFSPFIIRNARCSSNAWRMTCHLV
jgi:hypothetical protein